MAPRINLRQQEQTREAIKTTQLIKRLQQFALGETEAVGDKLVELDAGRLKAIEILLRKSLPDLSAITLTGDPDNPLEHNINVSAERFTSSITSLIKRTGTDETD